MEFNDSRVSDFKYEKLKEECFGDVNAGSSGGGGGGWSFGGSYGKSAYMLFYERRKKKDLKVVVPVEEVEKGTAGDNVVYDEEKKEHTKMVHYRKGADNDVPNDIYRGVFNDNHKFTFENDIYSQEFFDFTKSILTSIANLGDSENPEVQSSLTGGIQVARKVIFDILARCTATLSSGMSHVVKIMIDIFEKDQTNRLCKNFVEGLLAENNAEPVLEILLDCTEP